MVPNMLTTSITAKRDIVADAPEYMDIAQFMWTLREVSAANRDDPPPSSAVLKEWRFTGLNQTWRAGGRIYRTPISGDAAVILGGDEEVPHGVRALLMDFGIGVPACPGRVGGPAPGRRSISRVGLEQALAPDSHLQICEVGSKSRKARPPAVRSLVAELRYHISASPAAPTQGSQTWLRPAGRFSTLPAWVPNPPPLSGLLVELCQKPPLPGHCNLEPELGDDAGEWTGLYLVRTAWPQRSSKGIVTLGRDPR
jgi:hypothetical protein